MRKGTPHFRSRQHLMIGHCRGIKPSSQNGSTLKAIPTQSFPNWISWILCWNCNALQLLLLPNSVPLTLLQVFSFPRAFSVNLHSISVPQSVSWEAWPKAVGTSCPSSFKMGYWSYITLCWADMEDPVSGRWNFDNSWNAVAMPKLYLSSVVNSDGNWKILYCQVHCLRLWRGSGKVVIVKTMELNGFCWGLSRH